MQNPWWGGFVSWLSNQWHSLYLAGQRRNHRLLGFYRYHLDTLREKTYPLRAWMHKVVSSPRAGATARHLVFWPLMAVATVILYRGQVPIYTPYVLPVNQSQSMPNTASSTFKPYDALHDKVEPKLLAVQKPTSTPPAAGLNNDIVQPVTASKAANPPSVDAGSATPTNDSAKANATESTDAKPVDTVAQTIANLPHFVASKVIQPVVGQIVRSKGWYRHPEYGDWRLSPGVAIQPNKPSAVVKAAYTGVVSQVQKNGDATWSVVLRHQDKWESEYQDLEKVSVQPGALVKQGEAIGIAQASVSASVSFILRHENNLVDPRDYLQ